MSAANQTADTTGETTAGETIAGETTAGETATGETATGETATGQAIVETNNLHQVIQHFDDSGELIDNKTRIKIECQICMCKDLALTNRELDPLDKESHESYAVLPRCGHAFGHSCLQRWIKTQRAQRNYDPKCPSCRTPLLCEKMHALTLTEIGFMGRGSKTQAEDVVGVRNTLQMADCSRCLTRREEYERAMAQLPEAERIARRNEMPEWIESQQRAVDGRWLRPKSLPLKPRCESSLVRERT
ncbi:hypothetical protein GGS24DRAFT_475350, partial [Hypoxylon argillaceum]